jgi:hypothetical protein|tara:strand:+ start:124 stop:762 length:639 start_codon:yes stop_codon:yes gene_type:complete
MTYDAIHIQKHVKEPFYLIIPNKDTYLIRKERMYQEHTTKFIQELLNLYTPNDEAICIVYDDIAFYALMMSTQKYNCVFINKSQGYNKFVQMMKELNDVRFINLNTRFKVNAIVKDSFIPLLIVNDVIDSLNARRCLSKNFVHNIIILRTTYKDDRTVYRDLARKNYSFYAIKQNIEKIKDIYTFLQEDATTNIYARCYNSKYSAEFTVFFD